MSRLFAFRATRFDVARESPNPINPIAGEGLLNWLKVILTEAQYQVSKPVPEDFGWYIDVRGADASYMVVASGDAQAVEPEHAWTIQVRKHSSLVGRLLGEGELKADDPLAAVVESSLRGEAGIRDIEITCNV
jgi:hypothetical protein